MKIVSQNSLFAKEVKRFCSEVGVNPLLVQGAGGNVSWKDGDILWVKASGTWLAEAEIKEIFVPVNLVHLQNAIAKEDYSISPVVSGDSNLRPSIETFLHALMPHRIIVHLHAVEILAYLVRSDSREKLKELIGDAVDWCYVEYQKPGGSLARAVSKKLIEVFSVNVVFLENHGVVIGGETIEDIALTLRVLISKLRTDMKYPIKGYAPQLFEPEFLKRGYIACSDREINELACKDGMADRLSTCWALYPDHVVFLGDKPSILSPGFGFDEIDQLIIQKPPFIFVIDDGVYESTSATAAQKSQLRCYYDVLARQNSSNTLSTLSRQQVAELLNWDAEVYRKNSVEHNLINVR